MSLWTARRKRLALLASCAALYLVCRRAYYVGFFNDDAFYIIGARSLLEGRYAELNAPGQPPLVNYLPGFSLLLTPAAALGGQALWPYQLLTCAFMLAGLWLFAVAAESLTPQAPLAALALAALAPLTVSMSGAVLSDVPLLAAVMAALVWARRLWESESLKRWLALALLLGFSCLLRPTGAALALAFAAALCWERRWRLAALCSCAAGALVLPFLWRNRLLTGHGLMYALELSQPYAGASRWSVLRDTVALNLAYYLKFCFVTMMFRWPADSAFLTAATVGAGTAAVFYGLADGGWKGWRKLPALFLLIFAGTHLIWSKQAGRYVLPALPLVFAYALRGFSVVASRARVSGPKAALGAAALVLALFAVPDLRVARASLRRDTAVTRPPERFAAWVAARTRPEDVFAAELDGRLHLLTGRRVVHLRRLFKAEEFGAWLAANRVRYVVVSPNEFMMTTAGGQSPNDPMPPTALRTLLSDGALYEPAFADDSERLAVYRVKP